MLDNAQADSSVRPGQILAEKYRVERVLGAGGMGVVVAATHLELDEPVALKFLHPEVAKDPSAFARFAREARASVKIKSEHVARTLDVGRLDDGSPYMVMEYLEGTDLSARLETVGPLPVTDAVDFLVQALDAVSEAHSLGIVHRDLKPSNLFVVRRNDGFEIVKVLDFGISKITGGTMQMTSTAAVMGSPYYMSPEQMESAARADARSDIWALGVTLFELLCNQVPFSGQTLPEVCLRVVNQPLPAMLELRPSLPPGLAAVVERCVAKHPEDRFQNVAELARALAPFASERARHVVDRVSRVITQGGRVSREVVADDGGPASLGEALNATEVSPQGQGTSSADTAGEPPGGQTASPWSHTAPGQHSLARRRAIGAVAAAMVVAGAASYFWWQGSAAKQGSGLGAASVKQPQNTARPSMSGPPAGTDAVVGDTGKHASDRNTEGTRERTAPEGSALPNTSGADSAPSAPHSAGGRQPPKLPNTPTPAAASSIPSSPPPAATSAERARQPAPKQRRKPTPPAARSGSDPFGGRT